MHGGINRTRRNNYFTEMCSGSEEGSSSRPMDFLHQSTLDVRVTQKKRIIR